MNHRKSLNSKRSRARGLDRISPLPDHLIHKIFSFLEIYDVIRMCKVSTRWRHLWKTTPTLNFGNWEKDWDDGPIPIPSILSGLAHYEGSKISRLCAFSSTVSDPHDIRSLIRFATSRGVEELDLEFRQDCTNMLPRSLFNCETLRILRLSCLYTKFPESVSFRLIKTLELHGFTMPNLDTSLCPFLENLSVKFCSQCHSIYAPNEKLRCLQIQDSVDVVYDDGGMLTVYAPNVLSITLLGTMRWHYKMKDISSLKRAAFDFLLPYLFRIRPVSDDAEILVELLNLFRHAKSLVLCERCIMILAFIETMELKRSPLNMTYLHLQTPLKNKELPAITSLLKSPHLESLTVEMCNDPDAEDQSLCDDLYIDETESWKLLELALSTNSQLKTVQIHHFFGAKYCLLHRKPKKPTKVDRFLDNWDSEIKFVKLLLKGCTKLEKLFIQITVPCAWPWKLELLHGLEEKLLIFPRTSLGAEIQVSF